MTRKICEIRDRFSKNWHRKASVWSHLSNCGFESKEQYEAFCAAKDWLQDTGEALLTHREIGFGDDCFLAYIEFWGVMQAIFIQQDAISELNFAVHGRRLDHKKQCNAWQEIRNGRNTWTGHPLNKTQGEIGSAVRSYTGRDTKSYQNITVNYHSGRAQRTERVDLGSLIDRYENCALTLLHPLFSTIEAKLVST